MTPLCISFPVIDARPYLLAVPQDAPVRAILVRMQPIKPADARLDPTHCTVDACLEHTGKIHRFIIPIRVYRMAAASPVFFAEQEQVRGPQAQSVIEIPR